MWKVGIIVAGMLLLLVLMVWVPESAADAYEGASGLATPLMGTAQATPTEDATVTALNKEKLAQEVQQLKNQNESDLLGWLRANAVTLLSTLVVVIGALIGLFRWFGDRRSEREKRAEERFQAVCVGLGGEREEAKAGAAIVLRTFLRPGYEQFYTQTFDLAVAHLRLPRTFHSTEGPDGLSHSPEDSDVPLPLTTLSQALIVVFKEAFPLAREWTKKRRTLEFSFLQKIKVWLKLTKEQFAPQFLGATGVQLDNAYLNSADLEQTWMPHASLRSADLVKANLVKANLVKANLIGAVLFQANLSQANLGRAYLKWAYLKEADLSEASLYQADLYQTNIEDALSVKGTDLRRVKGLTKEQLETCKAKGAITDEVPATSPPQLSVSPSPPLQSTDAHASSVPPAQVNTPPPETDGSNAPSSQQSNGTQAQSAPPAQESMPTSDIGGGSATSSDPSPGA